MQVDDEHFERIVALTYPVWTRDRDQTVREINELQQQFPFTKTRVILALIAHWLVGPRLHAGQTQQQLVDLTIERTNGFTLDRELIEGAIRIGAGDASAQDEHPASGLVVGLLCVISAMLGDSPNPTNTMVSARERLAAYNLPESVDGDASAH